MPQLPITRRRLLGAASSAASCAASWAGMASLGVPLAARAQQAQTLRLGHVLGPTHPMHQGLELAAKRLGELSGGKLQMQVFPSSQLGTERDMHIAIRSGGIDMLLGSAGGASVHLKELAVLNAPFLFRDNPHWQGVVYGPIGEEWKRKITAASKLHIVGWFHTGTRHVISKSRPYNNLQAIANQKIRVADLPPYPQVFRALGAIPTPIAFAEMYSALQANVVDGADVPLDIIGSQKLYEVSKYVNLISWSTGNPGPILIGEAAAARVGADGLRMLETAVREGSNFVTDAMTKGENGMKAQLQQQGMTLVTPTDLPVWRTAGTKAIPELAATWGGDQALYKRISDHGA